MKKIVKNLVGEVPTEFTFIYSILTLVLAFLLISFLFQVFYIPIYLARGK